MTVHIAITIIINISCQFPVDYHFGLFNVKLILTVLPHHTVNISSYKIFITITERPSYNYNQSIQSFI